MTTAARPSRLAAKAPAGNGLAALVATATVGAAAKSLAADDKVGRLLGPAAAAGHQALDERPPVARAGLPRPLGAYPRPVGSVPVPVVVKAFRGLRLVGQVAIGRRLTPRRPHLRPLTAQLQAVSGVTVQVGRRDADPPLRARPVWQTKAGQLGKCPLAVGSKPARVVPATRRPVVRAVAVASVVENGKRTGVGLGSAVQTAPPGQATASRLVDGADPQPRLH